MGQLVEVITPGRFGRDADFVPKPRRNSFVERSARSGMRRGNR